MMFKPTSRLSLPLASALAGIVLTCSLHGQNGTWNVDADGNWNDDFNWLDTITADGTGSTAQFSADLTDNRIVTLGANRTIGNITFTDSTNNTNDLTISGANLLTLAATTPTVSVTQSTRTLTIDSEIAGTSGLTKVGPGSFTLSGANTYTGVTTLSAGALRITNNTALGSSLSFAKRLDATGLTYAIEESTDLGLADIWAEVTGTPPTYVNDANTISYTFTPGTPTKDFFRLKVTQTTP
jgi:autotransporter-associated beta strand protein